MSQKHSYDSSYPFRKKHCHGQQFSDTHALVQTKCFPNMVHLSKKDELWTAVKSKRQEEVALVRKRRREEVPMAVSRNRESNEEEAWSFLSFTLVLPQEWDVFLQLLSSEPSSSLWIAKPSRLNRGLGISLVNRDSDLGELRFDVCGT